MIPCSSTPSRHVCFWLFWLACGELRVDALTLIDSFLKAARVGRLGLLYPGLISVNIAEETLVAVASPENRLKFLCRPWRRELATGLEPSRIWVTERSKEV